MDHDIETKILKRNKFNTNFDTKFVKGQNVVFEV